MMTQPTLPMAARPNDIASYVIEKAASFDRFMIAFAGPPGAGKTTAAQAVCNAISKQPAAPTACVVPMDGFHFDNAVLDARGWRDRKGAPHTFDADGFVSMVRRLRQGGDIAVPTFDRTDDFSRAGARIVGAGDKIVIVEGNYLLLREQPWCQLHDLFDLTIMLDVPLATLEERLIERWRIHGLSDDDARARAMQNDIPNARTVIQDSAPPDWRIAQFSL